VQEGGEELLEEDEEMSASDEDENQEEFNDEVDHIIADLLAGEPEAMEIDENFETLEDEMENGNGHQVEHVDLAERERSVQEPVQVPETTGIAAIAEAARRYGMTEAQIISATGIDPNVLRDLPEYMHAEILREQMGPVTALRRLHVGGRQRPQNPAIRRSTLGTLAPRPTLSSLN
jgi:hypothetical protein